MSAIGTTSIVADLIPAGTLNPQPDGSVTLTINASTEEVLSVQPDGSFQTRPKGTAGAYERANLAGNVLVYCPDGKRPYAFPFFPDCPNV